MIIVAAAATTNNAKKKLIFKNCTPFTSCIRRINITQVDDVQCINVVMPMYNLIEYSDNYSTTLAILWQYCRDEPAFANNGDITGFNKGSAGTNLFKIKEKVTCQIGDNSTNFFEIMLPLKYLSNFWRILEITLTNCETSLDVTWSENCILVPTHVGSQITILFNNCYKTLCSGCNFLD